MIQAGYPPKWLQAIMGHASIRPDDEDEDEDAGEEDSAR
jgi:hypothetical protein